MKIIYNQLVPTGNIFVSEGSNGLIEFLSIGDYGQDINLNQHKKVPDITCGNAILRNFK